MSCSRNLLLNLFCCFNLFFPLSQILGQNYVSVIAEKGDGIYILLDRYQLRTPCNLNQFYKINQLRKNQGLRMGKEYQLPIILYSYNGKSIRSTTGKNDLPWAEKVQRYNEIMHQAQLKEKDYRVDKELWVPYHQMHCPDEDIQLDESKSENPFSEGLSRNPKNRPLRGTYAIFGEDYAQVPLVSRELEGCVYYVCSGHGGVDPGAVGRYGSQSLCEDEYAYDVSLRLAWNLLSHGATVYLITRDPDDGIRDTEILPCDKDETCWVKLEIPTNQKERLTQRSNAINSLYKRNKRNGVRFQRLIVVHVDSDSKREQIDMYFYHKESDPLSQDLAATLRSTMKEKYDYYRKGRGYTGTVSSRDLHMLRETDPTAVFIELGNIRNPNDQARLVIKGNRQLVANWLFDGLIRDAKTHK